MDHAVERSDARAGISLFQQRLPDRDVDTADSSRRRVVPRKSDSLLRVHTPKPEYIQLALAEESLLTAKELLRTQPKVMQPRVSVVIPVFNRAEAVPRAIASVLAQTCQDFEIIVVDDGSTDATASVVAAMIDPRITLVR